MVGFPRNKQGFDNIYVVVERFDKMAHFIPCKRVHDAFQAYLIFKWVVRIDGLPLSIVSERDTKFKIHFWMTLCHKILEYIYLLDLPAILK